MGKERSVGLLIFAQHGLEVWKTIRAGWDSLYRFVGYKVGEGLSMMLGMA